MSDVRARLVERDGAQGAVAHPTADGVMTIGRAADNLIVIDRPGVSRYHAEIRLDGGQYLVADLGSTNGTWLNGQRLGGPHPIQHGDILSLPAQPTLHMFFEHLKMTKAVVLEDPLDAVHTAGRDALRASRQGLRIDRRTAEVLVGDRRLTLTAKEYLALSVLYEQAGALVSKDELAKRVWPEYNGIVADQNIEQLISRLRRKLGNKSEPSGSLLNVRGLGYRLDFNQ